MGINFVDCNIPASKQNKIEGIVNEFVQEIAPLEKENVIILQDKMTKAVFGEFHIKAEQLLKFGTVDAPLDPENQAEYRANREVVGDSTAFIKMQADAKLRRGFSNIVSEYTKKYDKANPIKIIGGQHRFKAIEEAYGQDVNEYHGIKVYFALDTEQRLDVQLISNTNIAVSADLLDRMLETVQGPQLREWCQKTGLIAEGTDFADRKQRGGGFTVRDARTFVMNYYLGTSVDANIFDKERTVPSFPKTGGLDAEWEELKHSHPEMWEDEKLLKAGQEYVKLHDAQMNYYNAPERKKIKEYADKAKNYSIIAAWSYIAGVLYNNSVRLERHYNLPANSSGDPLNAAALAKAKHRTDPENYRGLGTRTDVKDRGRLAELFFLQAERGQGINSGLVDLAVKKYHAKQAVLEVIEAEKKQPVCSDSEK